MRWIRTAVALSLIAVGSLPFAALAQDVAAAPASPADVATPLRLPAALYDVIGAWDLGWGDAPGRGRPAASAAVVTRTVVRGPNGATTMRNAAAPVGQAALSSFVIGVDSVLYRRGSDWAEIAVAEITGVEEARWPENNRRAWVKITWVSQSVEQSIYFRQANASSQATLVATLRRAIELNRASATR